MGFFNEFPHTRTYDNDLGWLIKIIKELEINLQNFIKLNTVKYADPIQWDISTQYESNTVVIDALTGVAYISTQPVPSGVNINNTDYWTPVFTLDLVNLNKNITLRNDGDNHNATFASVVGDWVIVGGQLYKVIQDIGLYTAYVVGYNIQIYSVDMFVHDYLNQVINLIGDLQDLNTTDKTNLVNAINEVLSDIGDLQDLNTTDKTSVVNAINEVLSDMGDLLDLNTTDKTSVVNAINEVLSDMGDLQDLNTTDKTSVVNAINELALNNKNLNEYTLAMGAYVTPEMFGAAGDGIEDDTQSIIDALANGAICLCKNQYYTTSPIDIPSNKTLIVSGTIKYHGAESAIKQLSRNAALKGPGYIESDGIAGITVNTARFNIDDIIVSVTGDYIAAIKVETLNDNGIAYVVMNNIKLFGRDSSTYYGIGLYLHCTGTGFMNENTFNNVVPAFFEDGIRIYNSSTNNFNRNKFINYDGEGCTKSLNAYSSTALIRDNYFDFRMEEFGDTARIYIDRHVQRNKFSALGFAPKNFSVFNPQSRTLYTGSLVDANIIEGWILHNGGTTFGYNGAFHLNGDLVVFDVNSKREAAGYFDSDITIDYSAWNKWPLSMYYIDASATNITIDLNYHSDWCTSPIEYIKINNPSNTTLTIKNDTTILYGPNVLPKGTYKVIYNALLKTSIYLEQLPLV